MERVELVKYVRPVVNPNPKYRGGWPAPPDPFSVRAAMDPEAPLPLPPWLWPADDDTFLTVECDEDGNIL